MTKQVTREFNLVIWLFGRQAPDCEPIFHEETLRVEVACTGPLVDTDGHAAALGVLQKAVQPWLARHWENRLILPGEDEAFVAYCQRFSWGRKPYVLPKKNEPAAMARHLLEEVACPLLLGKGLNVKHVAVRLNSSTPCVAHYVQPPGQTKRQVEVRHLGPDKHVIQTTISYGPAFVG